ncbi:MAG: hypothetical protein JWP25_8939 [Bradyrhizobium sp.]|nr:hypothetical protein [Bradyrhizobium sp.]
MLILSSSTDSVKVVTTTATTTIDIHATWFDNVTGAITPDNTDNAAVAGAATTTAVAGPSTGQRNVRLLTICNTHASLSQAVAIQHIKAGGTATQLFKCTLNFGEALHYTEDGFRVFDAAGGVKSVGRTGRYLRTTIISNPTTSYTTGPDTNSIHVRLVAGGGQGGGCTVGSASISGGAGGGAAGGYAEKTFAVSPNTAYTVAVGLGGTTSGTGAVTGQAGGISTIAVGGVTVTANGGLGGIGCTSAATVVTLGGAAPAVSTNGDVNGSGEPGDPGFVSAVGVAISGKGGSSPFGAGGNALKAQGTGAAGIGNGSGGGGGCAISTTGAVAGGAGTNGLIVVDEYA